MHQHTIAVKESISFLKGDRAYVSDGLLEMFFLGKSVEL